jgi:hypothetical protein
MSSEKPVLYPVTICLMLGIVVAFILPSGRQQEPQFKPVVLTSNTVPVQPTVSMSSNEFMAYIESCLTTVRAQLQAATNPAERAVWEDIEKRLNQVDWTNAARALGQATNNSQPTKP